MEREFIINPEADYTPTDSEGGLFGMVGRNITSAQKSRNANYVKAYDANLEKGMNPKQASASAMVGLDSFDPSGAVGMGAKGAVKMISRLDEIMEGMSPKMKMRGDQLVGYLKSKGVSPKEIQASGLLEEIEPTDVRQIGEFIKLNPGRHRLHQRDQNFPHDDITLNRGGEDNPTYRVDITDIEGVRDKPSKTHFKMPVEDFGENVGWRRSHQAEINGKKTLVLDEIQSDWAQAERTGQGVFEGKLAQDIENMTPKQKADFEFIKDYNAGYETRTDKMFAYEDAYVNRKPTPFSKAEYEQITKERIDNRERYYDLLTDADDVPSNAAIRSQKMMMDDFPMKADNFYRNQIAMAIDDAEKAGLDRVIIPIKREGEDLMGTEGVTAFYDNLSRKVLPDLKKKLEKQGYKLNISKQDIKAPIEFSENAPEMVADAVAKRITFDQFDELTQYGTKNWIDPFSRENLLKVHKGEPTPGMKPELRSEIEFWMKDMGQELFESGDNVGHLIEILQIPSKPASLSTF